MRGIRKKNCVQQIPPLNNSKVRGSPNSLLNNVPIHLEDDEIFSEISDNGLALTARKHSVIKNKKLIHTPKTVPTG